MAKGVLNMTGREKDHQRHIDVQCPIHFYEAQIAAEAIIGYDWLARHNFIVVPRGHHLELRDKETCVVIMGMNHRKGKAKKRSETKTKTQVHILQSTLEMSEEEEEREGNISEPSRAETPVTSKEPETEPATSSNQKSRETVTTGMREVQVLAVTGQTNPEERETKTVPPASKRT